MAELVLAKGKQEEAHRWVDRAYEVLRQTGKPLVLKITEWTRTNEQNAKLWPMLKDVSEQVKYHGLTLSSESWKQLFLHQLLKDGLLVPDLHGTGVVSLSSKRSSVLTIPQFSDLIELIYAYGAAHGVKWSEKSQATIQENGDQKEAA